MMPKFNVHFSNAYFYAVRMTSSALIMHLWWGSILSYAKPEKIRSRDVLIIVLSIDIRFDIPKIKKLLENGENLNNTTFFLPIDACLWQFHWNFTIKGPLLLLLMIVLVQWTFHWIKNIRKIKSRVTWCWKSNGFVWNWRTM